MSSRARLTVPPHQEKGVQALLALSDDAYYALLNILGETKARLSADQFAQSVADAADVSFITVRNVLDLLVNLYSVRADGDIAVQGFVPAFVAAVRDLASEGRIALQEGDTEILERRLPSLLELEDTVGVVSKASYLWSQHEQVFRDAQILTDVRPVFRRRASDSPAAALVIHKMRITYLGSDSLWPRDIYIALDRRDMQVLRTALDRAIEKGESISQVLAHADVSVLEEE